jgi:hypothetical protein
MSVATAPPTTATRAELPRKTPNELFWNRLM